MTRIKRKFLVLFWTLLVCILAATAFGNAQLHPGKNISTVSIENLEVPALPFPDNPDPDACGIPQRWGSDTPAQLTGYYEGELVQPVVFLYDSHLRRAVTGHAESGTKVRVLLVQANPALNFYFVKTLGKNPQEGWVPAPFLRLPPT